MNLNKFYIKGLDFNSQQYIRHYEDIFGDPPSGHIFQGGLLLV